MIHADYNPTIAINDCYMLSELECNKRITKLNAIDIIGVSINCLITCYEVYDSDDTKYAEHN